MSRQFPDSATPHVSRRAGCASLLTSSFPQHPHLYLVRPPALWQHPRSSFGVERYRRATLSKPVPRSSGTAPPTSLLSLGALLLVGAWTHILAFAFPNEGRQLELLAEEAGLSRLYAGIHFRFDAEV